VTFLLVTTASFAQKRKAGFVAVALSATDSVILLDARTLERVAALRVGRNPHEIVASPDGRRAYIANAGATSITVIEVVPSPRVVTTWQLRDSVSVHDLAVSGDGQTLWAVSGAQKVLLEIEVSTGRERNRFDLKEPGGWMIETGGPDGALVIANLEGGAVTLVDPGSGWQTVVRATEGEIDASATLDRRELWSVNSQNGNLSVFDASNGKLLRQMRIAATASRVRFTRDGRRALIPSTSASSLTAVDVKTGRRISVLQVPQEPKVIALDLSSRHAYLSHPKVGIVSLVDLSNMSVLHTAWVGNAPDGVAVLEPR